MNKELNNGIKAFFVLGIYFIIIEMLGIEHTAFLRLLNIFIIAYFVNKSIVERVKQGKSFIALFGSAFITNFIAVILSTVALTVYIDFFKGIDHIETLAQPLLATGDFNLSLSQFSFAIFAEGFASGIILCFGMMQFWKNRISKYKVA